MFKIAFVAGLLALGLGIAPAAALLSHNLGIHLFASLRCRFVPNLSARISVIRRFPIVGHYARSLHLGNQERKVTEVMELVGVKGLRIIELREL